MVVRNTKQLIQRLDFYILSYKKIQISVSIIIILYLIVYSCALSYAW